MKYLVLFLMMVVMLAGMGFSATFYVDVTNGNDGVASANGYAYTAATKTIGKVGAFTAYTYHAGDQIQVTVTGTSSKVDVGFYTIAGKTSNDAITLTADASGTNEDDANVTLTVGNNGTAAATAAGSLNGPKKTISSAYDAVSTGDTIQLADGTYDLVGEVSGARSKYFIFDRELDCTVQGNSANRGAVILQSEANVGNFVVRGFATGTHTIKDLTITSTDCTLAVYADESTGGSGVPNMVLDNVVINQSTANSYAIDDAGLLNTFTSTRTFTIRNCDINHTGTSSGNSFGIYCRALNKFIIQDTTIDIATANTGGGFFIESSATPGTSEYMVNLFMDNVTMTVGSGAFAFRNLGTCNINISNCAFKCASATYVVQLGNDGGAAASEFAGAYIYNSSFLYTGTTGGHCFLLGPEAQNAIVDRCVIYAPPENSGSNLGFVIKGVTDVRNCNVTGETAILLKGGFGGCKITGNTLVSHGTYATSSCVRWGSIEISGVTYEPNECYIANNIMWAKNDSWCLSYADLAGTPSPTTYGLENYFDGNIYYGNTLLYDGSTAYTTLTTLDGFWDTQSDKYLDLRDVTSQNINPSLALQSDRTYITQNQKVKKSGIGASSTLEDYVIIPSRWRYANQ